MTWAQSHGESERYAIEAQLALRNKDFELSNQLYRKAARAEAEALNKLEKSKKRTRGITAVSAVALWFKAKEYSLSEQLAYSMLADPDIPEFAIEGLRNLVQAIWTESSKQKAGVEFIPGQVMVSVKGGEVVTGGAPLDLIVDKVQTIQSLFYRTIEYLNGDFFRKGKPPKELKESCRPWLFQSAPGSYQFSVAIQKPKQVVFFKNELEPERIAQFFLEIVNASSSEDSDKLENIVTDDSYRNTFLKLSRNLAPAGKMFDHIELRAAGDTRPVGLGIESRININKQLRQKITQLTPIDEMKELRGVLRAVHLDKDWLEIVVDGKPLHVEGLQDTVDDVIGPMVNRSVIVQVTRQSAKKFRFVDIELAE